MTQQQIIKDFVYNRENTLSVKSMKINISNSVGNPSIFVGTIPNFKDKNKFSYVISYGRYLNCEMLCYGTYKKDKGYFETNSKSIASRRIAKIYNEITGK